MIEILKNNPIFLTAAIAEAMKDRKTAGYVGRCMERFCSGDFGDICREDTTFNLEQIARKEGRALGAYGAFGFLQEPIFIIAEFSCVNPCDLDMNHTTVLYRFEY